MTGTLSTAQVARRYGVGIHKVLLWIRTGEIHAVNVSLAARPMWRISEEALAEFERRRANQARPPARRKKSTAHQYRYF